jgi:hypothetical protein
MGWLETALSFNTLQGALRRRFSVATFLFLAVRMIGPPQLAQEIR